MNNNILHTGVAIGFWHVFDGAIFTAKCSSQFAHHEHGLRTNPLTSIGGTAYDGENKFLMTAPSNFDLIITDVILTSTTNVLCNRTHKSEFILGSGPILGQLETSSGMVVDNGTWGASSDGGTIQHAFTSGLRVPAGDSLSLMITETSNYTYNGSCATSASHGVRYMVSGHYVTRFSRPLK